MPLNESLDIYFMDSIEVIYNGQPIKAILDEYEQVVLEGPMGSGSTMKVRAITVKTSDVVGIENSNSTVTINSVVYKVNQRLRIQDGKMTHLLLGD